MPKPRELYLRRGAERRLCAGHLWVYSNEVDSARSALTDFAVGDWVLVRGSNGQLLGSAYMEPHNLICARVFAAGREASLEELLPGALSTALAGRELAFELPFYRLVYGGSDNLPGLVVDRFGDYLVVQLNNAGIERYESQIISALVDLLQPAGILLRADSRKRREQGLESRVEVVFGEVPEQVELQENGVVFQAPVLSGQKTGWFYDHRMARARLAPYVAGRSVLDVYSYIGGWGVQAAAFGASSVCCLDSSALALDGVKANARLNNLSQVSTLQGSAAESMEALAAQGQHFELVILDPPAFIQRRKDIKKGIKAYRRINELGLKLLAPGGVLVSASCSMHLTRTDLIAAVQSAAVRVGKDLRLIEQGAQGPDHPIHPAIPETEYLKALFFRAL
ncbi:class I SAM-dependent rRNA methyltransferase [Parahaliea sp. F7430]|uniref:Class I SAM-dependent rRNA methyltransferase n=1 Tax=Sediminihaliea albiluteola TaxID=2758564 RepID=A0A7W2YJU5_9GAMM|nr:class I SAM-dependent rRNA methyltransferase [Sediminihaliea albiluteola]MBA6413525.1 class I SAM-dependent rRNA methyltransferase [Sediminihaliea albiluteola]